MPNGIDYKPEDGEQETQTVVVQKEITRVQENTLQTNNKRNSVAFMNRKLFEAFELLPIEEEMDEMDAAAVRHRNEMKTIDTHSAWASKGKYTVWLLSEYTDVASKLELCLMRLQWLVTHTRICELVLTTNSEDAMRKRLKNLSNRMDRIFASTSRFETVEHKHETHRCIQRIDRAKREWNRLCTQLLHNNHDAKLEKGELLKLLGMTLTSICSLVSNEAERKVQDKPAPPEVEQGRKWNASWTEKEKASRWEMQQHAERGKAAKRAKKKSDVVRSLQKMHQNLQQNLLRNDAAAP